MKRLLFFCVLFVSCAAYSQDLTGVWRGYFYAGSGMLKEYYKYEVQIDQLKNNSLKGVTYSYRTTVFYGKANFDGIWFTKAKSLTLRETNLIDVKMADNSQACAMTSYLDYSTDGKTEILKGTFTSVNTATKSDCGSGTVYLERVKESDFVLEDFLLKKQHSATPPPAKNTKPKSSADSVKPKAVTPPDVSTINAKKIQSALGVPQDGKIGPKTNAAIKQKAPSFKETLDLTNTAQVTRLITIIKHYKPVAKKQPPASPSVQSKTESPVIATDSIAKAAPQQEQPIVQPKKNIPVPEVIRSRSNPLIKTITTASQDIKIELYDNGDIDGDTITVYDNNEAIAWKKGLTKKPITLNLKADAATPVHEIVMTADNLGSIPPNTALMIVTTGGKRYQVFISSDKQKNAKVIVQYQPASN